jgi:hypothetical protein
MNTAIVIILSLFLFIFLPSWITGFVLMVAIWASTYGSLAMLLMYHSKKDKKVKAKREKTIREMSEITQIQKLVSELEE